MRATALDVTIVPGGPQANNRLLLVAGKIDFNLGANLIQAFDAVAGQVPIVAVASMFQKDPFVLLSHPGVGLDKLEDLHGAHAAFIGHEALVSVFQWLRTRYGFSPNIVKTYTFNAAPFIADTRSIQQGYATSEPFVIARSGGFTPNVFLLADYGLRFPIRRRSRRVATRSTSARTSCSASSMRRSSAGIITSTAIPPPLTR